MPKENMIKTILFSSIFLTVFVFFTTIHPVTIMNGDDWHNLSLGRKAFPVWHAFNPIKVVPEVFFPLFINISSSVIMPFGFTFLESASYSSATLFAALVTLFHYHLYMFFRERVNFICSHSMILSVFYFLCLFGLFRTINNNKSPYLLLEGGLTNYYHYIVPALINATFTLFLIKKPLTLSMIKNENPMKVGFLVLSSYLCIFSNIFSSVFLAVLCGIVILFEFIKNRFNAFDTMSKTPFHLYIFITWIVSTLYEANGGRSDMIGHKKLAISDAINSLLYLVKLINPVFFTILLIGIIAGIFLFSRNSNQSTACRYVYWTSIFSCVITFIALILISAKSSPNYAARPAAMWGGFMYIIIAASSSIGFLLKKYKWINYVAPTILLCLLNESTRQGPSLRETHDGNTSFIVANNISQFMVDQVIAADKANERKMTLTVPKGNDIDNWPFPVYRGKDISQTLKSNGIIHKNIEITMQPDENVNKIFDFQYH